MTESIWDRLGLTPEERGFLVNQADQMTAEARESILATIRDYAETSDRTNVDAALLAYQLHHEVLQSVSEGKVSIQELVFNLSLLVTVAVRMMVDKEELPEI